MKKGQAWQDFIKSVIAFYWIIIILLLNIYSLFRKLPQFYWFYVTENIKIQIDGQLVISWLTPTYCLVLKIAGSFLLKDIGNKSNIKSPIKQTFSCFKVSIDFISRTVTVSSVQINCCLSCCPAMASDVLPATNNWIIKSFYKKYVYFFLNQNVWCWYSKELYICMRLRWFFEYPQHMFKLIDKKWLTI